MSTTWTPRATCTATSRRATRYTPSTGTAPISRGNVSLYLSRNASQVYDVVVVRDGERVKFDDLRIEPYERVDENGNVSRVYGYALTVTEATFSTR